MSGDETNASANAETDAHAATVSAFEKRFGEGYARVTRFRDNVRFHVHPTKLLDALRFFKDELGFEQLSDLGATDYLGYPEPRETRFEVHYALLNLETTERVIVKTGLDDPDPALPSVVSMWKGADWMEREVYDMFGVTFLGHPDPRRILLPDEFTAHPLRKDYPLRGRGERHNFPRLTRDQA